MKNLTIDFAIHRIVAFPRWIPWHLRMTMTMRMRWTGFGWTSWRRLQSRSGQWARRHRYHWMNGTYDNHRRRIGMQTKGDEMNWMLVNGGCIWCINFRWNVANMHTLHSVNSISFCHFLHTKWAMGTCEFVCDHASSISIFTDSSMLGEILDICCFVVIASIAH